MAATGTPTSKLGLPQWNGSDPFLRSDFNTLMQTLDSTPGVISVADEASKTALAWNASKNGRLVVVRSTKRVYEWQSPSWIEYGALPRAWGNWDATDTDMNANGTYDKLSIISGTAIRPMTLAIQGQALINANSDGRFTGSVYVTVTQGGVTQVAYGGRANSYLSSFYTGAYNITVACQGLIPINAGSFTAGIRIVAESTTVGPSNKTGAVCKVFERSVIATAVTDGGSF
jgi:hypothetical protein